MQVALAHGSTAQLYSHNAYERVPQNEDAPPLEGRPDRAEVALPTPEIRTARDRLALRAANRRIWTHHAEALGRHDRAVLHAFIGGIFEGALAHAMPTTPEEAGHPEFAEPFEDSTVVGPRALEETLYNKLAKQPRGEREMLFEDHYRDRQVRNRAWEFISPDIPSAPAAPSDYLTHMKQLSEEHRVINSVGKVTGMTSAAAAFVASVTMLGHVVGVPWPISATVGSALATTSVALGDITGAGALGTRLTRRLMSGDRTFAFTEYLPVDRLLTRNIVEALREPVRTSEV